MTNLLTHSLHLLPKLRTEVCACAPCATLLTIADCAQNFEDVKKQFMKAINQLETGTISP